MKYDCCLIKSIWLKHFGKIKRGSVNGDATHTKHYLEFSESEVDSERSVVSYQILTSVCFLYPALYARIYKVMVLFQTAGVLMSDIDPEWQLPRGLIDLSYQDVSESVGVDTEPDSCLRTAGGWQMSPWLRRIHPEILCLGRSACWICPRQTQR